MGLAMFALALVSCKGGDDAVPTVARARPAGEAGARGQHGGFNLHAGTTVGAHDAAARERVCQYLLRPPISDDRLTALPDGRVSPALKRLSSSPASRLWSRARGRTS